MTTTVAGLDAILATLKERREKLARGETSHPIGSLDNNTSTARTGDRAAEHTEDIKAQNPQAVEAAKADRGGNQEAGSIGVDAKDATQPPADKPDTSGVSEMAEQGTTHPSKSAREILRSRLKVAKMASEGRVVEDEAAFRQYCEELVKNYPDDFAAGCKFAADVLQTLDQAAAAQQAAEKQAAEQLLSEAALAEAAARDPMLKLAAELDAAGVTPEELSAALADEGASDAAGGDVDPEAAQLAQVLDQLGVTPEELQAALTDENAGAGDAAVAADDASDAAAAADEAEKAAAARLIKEAAEEAALEQAAAEGDDIAQIAQLLDEAGVTPEELVAALESESSADDGAQLADAVNDTEKTSAVDDELVKLAVDLDAAGVTPDELQIALAAEDDPVLKTAAALDRAGVTAEELDAYLKAAASPEALTSGDADVHVSEGEAPAAEASEEEQLQALEEALKAEGVTPEQLAQAVKKEDAVQKKQAAYNDLVQFFRKKIRETLNS